MSSRNSPQGINAPNLGFRNRIEGVHMNEVYPNPNRVPQPHVLNALIMDEPIKEQVELENNLEEP